VLCSKILPAAELNNLYYLIPSCQRVAPPGSDWQRDTEVQSSGEFSLRPLWINTFLMSSVSVPVAPRHD